MSRQESYAETVRGGICNRGGIMFGEGHAKLAALKSCRRVSGCKRRAAAIPGNRLWNVALFLALSLLANAAFPDNVNGAWLSPSADNWPFVPLHAALTPDGRVLTFGSNAAGQPTGNFSYDVWDPEEGLTPAAHTTLQNMTLTDIFCSYVVILPTNGNMLIAGGDVWNGSKVRYIGNNDSTIFTPSDSLLSSGNEMKRARWYATATPMMNGEVYIQGGKGGAETPELRDVFGQFRTL